MTMTDRLAGINEGVAVKAPCVVATTTNTSLTGLQTIDGVLVTAGNRVLVKNQTNPVENGIWIASAGAWTRAPDFNGLRDIVEGTTVLILNGATQANTFYRIDTADPVIGVSQLTFTFCMSGTLSTQAQAEAGTNSTALMTPLRTKQQISMFVPTPTSSVQGSGLPGINNGQWFVYRDSAAAEGATLRVDRNSTYSGGTPGVVQNALWVNHTVGANVTDFQWTVLGQLLNNADAGENCAGYFQATQTSTGPTFGAVIEARATAAAPVAPLVGLEVDVFANGSTTLAWPLTQRVAVDLVFGRPGNTGTAMNVDVGLRITGNANAKPTRSIAITSPTLVGFDMSEATLDAGGDAIRLASPQPVNFNAGGNARRLVYSSSVFAYQNHTGDTLFSCDDSGTFTVAGAFATPNYYKVGSNQVVGARVTGWAAATGTATRSTFATSTVTTAQLAERVKALIDDLTTHGLIGA